MNEFAARKIGEVLAFAQVGLETYERAKVALVTALGADKAAELMDGSRDAADGIVRLAAETGTTDAVMKKADATSEKLRAMRDLYLKEDGWQDPAEVCEWLGFFEGSAAVHWAVVLGAADALGLAAVRPLGEANLKLHQDALNDIIEAAGRLAKKKASS